MNPIQQLAATLQQRFPQATVSVEPPVPHGGTTFLDIKLDGHLVVVQWKHDKGFGLSCAREYYLGEGCDEVYPTLQATFDRVEALLLHKTYTSSPYAVREMP